MCQWETESYKQLCILLFVEGMCTYRLHSLRIFVKTAREESRKERKKVSCWQERKQNGEDVDKM